MTPQVISTSYSDDEQTGEYKLSTVHASGRLVRNTVPIDLAHHVCGGLGQLGSLTSLPVGT